MSPTATRRKPARHSALRTSFDDLGDTYGMIYEGNEFAPEFKHGDTVLFSTNDHPEQGDIVIVWLKPEFTSPGQPQCSVWRLGMSFMPSLKFPYEPNPLSEVHPVIMLESGRPEQFIPVPASNVLAIHRKAGVYFTRGKAEAPAEEVA